MKKLQALKDKLRVWYKEVFGNIEETKCRITLDLEVLDRLEESRISVSSEREERWKQKLELEKVIKK